MQSNRFDFSSIRLLLVNPDKFKQSDGARKVFDEWYRVARLFAQGTITIDVMAECTRECIFTMFITHAPEQFVKRDIDYYVISSLMKGFRNLLTILTTKPKFQPICSHDIFIQTVDWIRQYGIPQLTIGTKNDRIDSMGRIEYSDSLGSLLDFGYYLSQAYPTVYPTSPFFLLSPDLYAIGFNVNENLSLRQSLLRCVPVMLKIDCIQTLPIVAPLIRDSEGCSVIWCLAVLNNDQAVGILQKAIHGLIKKQGVDALLLFYNSMNDYVSKLYAEINQKEPAFIDVILYHFCNLISTVVSGTTQPSANELSTIPEEIISGRVLLQSLIHYFPNNNYVLDFVFSQHVIELFPIAAITSPYLDSFNDFALLNYLFPYLSNTISHMSVAGVSGNEEDQDTINLLRDLAQSLMNATTRPIHYEVGHMLFHTLLLAMRRGYIETERFPEVTANVIAFYAIKPSSIPPGMHLDPSIRESSTWILELFDGSEDRHRDIRAIKAMISVIMGMKEEEGTMNSKIDPEISECVIEQFLRIHHIEVLQIFKDILLSVDRNLQIDSISTNIQSKLLYSINNWVINDSSHISSQAITTVFLPLLRALTPIVHPSLSYLLLEVTTRVLLLYNSLNCGGGSGNQAVITTENVSYTLRNPRVLDSVMDDSLITGILERAPRDDESSDEMYYTSTSVIQKLIEIAGVSSRIQIAHFFPYYCLTDENIHVRCSALESISRYSDLVCKYYNEILLGLEMRVSGNEAHLKIGLVDLFRTAAPVLRMLAEKSIIYTPQCIIYLIEGIELSLDNDVMNEPDSSIINALHTIYSSTDPKYISDICLAIQSYNQKYYSLLMKYCPEWELEKRVNPLLYQQQHQQQVVPQNDPWTQSWNQIHAVQAKGPAGFLESIRYIDLMRKNELSPQRQQLLSQYIMSTLLPAISAYYLPQLDANQQFVITPMYIQNALSVLNVITLLEESFPQESEYLLHLQAMTTQVVETAKASGCDPAFVAQLQNQANRIRTTYMQAVSYVPSQQLSNQQILQKQIDIKASSFATQLQSSVVATAMSTPETMRKYEEEVRLSTERLRERVKNISNPQREEIPQLFPSLESISVSNTPDQLQELGMGVMKRTESKASIQEIDIMEEDEDTTEGLETEVVMEKKKEDEVKKEEEEVKEEIKEDEVKEETKGEEVKEEMKGEEENQQPTETPVDSNPLEDSTEQPVELPSTQSDSQQSAIDFVNALPDAPTFRYKEKTTETRVLECD